MRVLATVAWLAATASCGRVGFDSVLARAPVHYVASFVARSTNVPTVTFTAHAQAPGNTIVVHVECNKPATGASVTGTGWSFAPIGQIANPSPKAAQTLIAIAPDTAQISFTAGWATACPGMDVLGDEFTSAGPIAIDSHVETGGTGSPATDLTTASDGATIWAACSSSGTLSAVASDYTKASDDTHDDWSAYRETTDPAGTTEHVTFTNTGLDYALTVVALIGPAEARDR